MEVSKSPILRTQHLISINAQFFPISLKKKLSVFVQLSSKSYKQQ